MPRPFWSVSGWYWSSVWLSLSAFPSSDWLLHFFWGFEIPLFPSWSACQLGGLLACKFLSSFTAPSQECWFPFWCSFFFLFFLFLFFLLFYLSYVEGFLPYLEVWSLLSAFNVCSVNIILDVNGFFFFDVLVREGEFHILLLHHLDPASKFTYFR